MMHLLIDPLQLRLECAAKITIYLVSWLEVFRQLGYCNTVIEFFRWLLSGLA